MVTAMVAAIARVVVVPSLVVNGNPHFRRVAIVHTVGASVVFLPPKVLGVVYVWVVVVAAPVSSTV